VRFTVHFDTGWATSSANAPLYGGIKAVNREVCWHSLNIRDLFATFEKVFQELTSGFSASRPLVMRKIDGFGCQKIKDREVGWQKVRSVALLVPSFCPVGLDREVYWQGLERLAGKIERSTGMKREARWHGYGEVYWQP